MTSAESGSLPIGVAAVLAPSPSTATPPTSTILAQFALSARVAVVTGGHRGIGLEMALALAEAGAIVYCLDLPAKPDGDWEKVKQFVDLTRSSCQLAEKGRLEYVPCDVTDQKGVWKAMEEVARKEGRLDVCIACAGVLHQFACLDYPADEFKKLMDINVNGVMYTAQAAGRQMKQLGIPGSIILIASMSGSIANEGMPWTAYNTSKAAVIQMARSLACELGPAGIRVNSISPGYVYTEMTKTFLQRKPELMAKWCSENPLGRLALPHEMRGVALWLAGDMSTFCTGSDIIVDGGHRAW